MHKLTQSSKTLIKVLQIFFSLTLCWLSRLNPSFPINRKIFKNFYSNGVIKSTTFDYAISDIVTKDLNNMKIKDVTPTK